MTALFRSAHEALLYAYTYSDARGHAVAAAAERQIATFARDRYGRTPGSGRGLVGLDGAAQAGMIQAEIARMHPLLRDAIEARFAVLDVSRRQMACARLALRARHAVACPLDALVMLMRREHGLRVSTGRVADDHDVADRTVRRWNSTLRRWLRDVRQRSMDDAERRLCEAGVVESA